MKKAAKIAVEINIWERRLKKFMELLVQAETEEDRKIIEDYIDKNLMSELGNI
jgi:deoxyadenosine/deoxycytidine kinase